MEKVIHFLFFFFLGCPCHNEDDILYGIAVEWIASKGFTRYLKSEYGKLIGDHIYPPTGAVEVLMGCGNDTDHVIQLAAIMTPDEIFDRKNYPYKTVTNAKSVRNYYAYHSSIVPDPIGFTQDQRIYLRQADYYDCSIENRCGVENMDKHRLSVYKGMYTTCSKVWTNKVLF